MKRFSRIGTGLWICLVMTHGPLSAIEKRGESFAEYAGKSAELYRGQLLTRLEMSQLADELSRQTRRASALPRTYLNSLKENPYDLPLNAWILHWVEREYNARGPAEQKSKDKLKSLMNRLKKHYEVLTQLADSYQG